MPFVTSQRVYFKHTLSSKLDTHVTVTISKVGPLSNGPDQVTDLCFIKPTAMIHATKKQPSCNHRRFMSSWLNTRSTTREEESLTFWSSLSDKCLLLNFLFPEGLSLPSGDASFSEQRAEPERVHAVLRGGGSGLEAVGLPHRGVRGSATNSLREGE